MVVASSNVLVNVIPGLMLWTLILFAITLWILKRYAFGPIQKLIDDRRERIKHTVEEADRARDEAKNLLEQQRALLSQARGEAEGILSEARKIGDAQQERMREETEEERQRRLEETRRQIDQATAQALGELKREVATLSLLAAEKITRKSLTKDDQERLIDEALAEIDFSALEASSS